MPFTILKFGIFATNEVGVATLVVWICTLVTTFHTKSKKLVVAVARCSNKLDCLVLAVQYVNSLPPSRKHKSHSPFHGCDVSQ